MSDSVDHGSPCVTGHGELEGCRPDRTLFEPLERSQSARVSRPTAQTPEGCWVGSRPYCARATTGDHPSVLPAAGADLTQPFTRSATPTTRLHTWIQSGRSEITSCPSFGRRIRMRDVRNGRRRPATADARRRRPREPSVGHQRPSNAHGRAVGPIGRRRGAARAAAGADDRRRHASAPAPGSSGGDRPGRERTRDP